MVRRGSARVVQPNSGVEPLVDDVEDARSWIIKSNQLTERAKVISTSDTVRTARRERLSSADKYSGQFYHARDSVRQPPAQAPG